MSRFAVSIMKSVYDAALPSWKFPVETTTLTQYNAIMQNTQGNMMKNMNVTEQTVASDAHVMTYSGTPQGVEQQRRDRTTTVNQYQKRVETFFAEWANHALRSYLSAMGGKQALASGLDRMLEMPPLFDESYYGFVVHEIREMQVMNMGNYAHGNQPVQHALYLYDWCGQPWKTQKYVREVMDRFYSATPDGYCGDEDNGQTSAWYVFSSLGFYRVSGFRGICDWISTI